MSEIKMEKQVDYYGRAYEVTLRAKRTLQHEEDKNEKVSVFIFDNSSGEILYQNIVIVNFEDEERYIYAVKETLEEYYKLTYNDLGSKKFYEWDGDIL